jgi:two-component system, NtrC family, sensor histidine kinase HydH
MNRNILIKTTTPAFFIGLLLFGTCLVSAWYIGRLQSNMAQILSENVTSLEAAQTLEIKVRQLRFHSFVYLIDPTPEHLKPVKEDHDGFEEAMQQASQSAKAVDEEALVREIRLGYQKYHDELATLEEQVRREGPIQDHRKLANDHPVRHIVDPCRELLRINKRMIEKTSEETNQVAREARWAMLLLGLVGPVSGLFIGYSVARKLSRSIYQLSVRVNDMAQCLDQQVTSVSVSADGDIESLDKQLQHVVQRVEEVAERMQQHQRDMLRAEQLAAVGKLAANVAHEVRNPLMAVKMLVEAALRPQNARPLTTEGLSIIHREVGRVEKTVQGLLDFARLPAPQRSVCDIRELVTKAVELVRVRCGQQHVELVVECPKTAVPANLDPEQIHRVLVNLLLNALDAMPHGGRLEVRVEASPDRGIRVTTADSGEGIPESVLSRLFMPFISTKPTGTGLGLSISQRIIEEHGGNLSASNRRDGGASFTFTLPGVSGESAYADLAGH